MRATIFALSLLETGRPLGHALVCPGARYAMVAWVGQPEPERRYAPTHVWAVVEKEYRVGMPSVGPLDAGGALSQLLLPESLRRDIVIARFADLRLTPADPRRMAGALDAAFLGLLAGSRR